MVWYFLQRKRIYHKERRSDKWKGMNKCAKEAS
jgi:hypothetical protein